MRSEFLSRSVQRIRSISALRPIVAAVEASITVASRFLEPLPAVLLAELAERLVELHYSIGRHCLGQKPLNKGRIIQLTKRRGESVAVGVPLFPCIATISWLPGIDDRSGKRAAFLTQLLVFCLARPLEPPDHGREPSDGSVGPALHSM